MGKYAMRTLLAVALMTGSALAQSAVTGGGFTLRSQDYAAPSGDHALPGAADLVTANCTGCHSAGMMLNQPALSATTWTEEVNKMRSAYKAPVAAEDVPAIVAYLSQLKPGS